MTRVLGGVKTNYRVHLTVNTSQFLLLYLDNFIERCYAPSKDRTSAFVYELGAFKRRRRGSITAMRVGRAYEGDNIYQVTNK